MINETLGNLTSLNQSGYFTSYINKLPFHKWTWIIKTERFDYLVPFWFIGSFILFITLIAILFYKLGKRRKNNE